MPEVSLDFLRELLTETVFRSVENLVENYDFA